MMEITINDTQYRLKRKPQPSPTVRKLSAIAAMASAFEIIDPYGRQKPTPQYDLDYVVQEFKLIQQKQSKLSSQQRQNIIVAFKNNFEPTSRKTES